MVATIISRHAIINQQRLLHKRMASNWTTEKSRLEKLALDERRKQYSCRDAYVALDCIPTWRQYFHQHEKSLTEKLSEKDVKSFENQAQNQAHLADKISLFKGDITKLEIDAIVNAANEALLGGGGVDGAIHRAAGKLLVEECRTLHGCDPGFAKITGGYNLPAKNVIHTVGPRGEKPKVLQSCYETCLHIMLENNLKTIAFPCISTGIFGYPPENAANVALKTVKEALLKHSDLDRVIFCVFLESDVDIYEKLLQLHFPVH